MKKVSLKGKLSLNKVTVSKLNKDQMNNVNGGQRKTYTCGGFGCTYTVQMSNCADMSCAC
jgi:natural product precursor